MHKIYKNILIKEKGFTLVELLVVLIMLAILLMMAIYILNPISQLNKAKDAQRKQDFIQIRNALDTYYNDHNCYPQSGSLPFGSPWIEDNIAYMAKVPQDPGVQCINGKCYSYNYQTDGSVCPQWAILYARLGIAPAKGEECATKIIRTMCPKPPYSVNINIKYNYCLPIGQINCTALSSLSAPSGFGSPTPTPIPTPTPTPTPTPIPTPTPTLVSTPTPVPTCGVNNSGWTGCPGNHQACNSESFDNCIQFGGTIPCWCSDDCNGNQACNGY